MPDPSTPASLPPAPAWRTWHIVVGLACIVVIVAGIKAVAPLVNSLLLAIVLSLMIAPILEWFSHRNRWRHRQCRISIQRRLRFRSPGR